MRFISIVIALLFSIYLNADEIQRIESIVQEIETLRSDYAKTEDALEISEYKRKDLEEKNKILENELKTYSDFTLKERNYKAEIASLEKKVEELEKRVKTKEKNNNILKDREIKKVIIKEKPMENQFPKLKMKKEYSAEVLEYTKANTYRTECDAAIYNRVDGDKISFWESGRSFTSNIRTENWIKITGYFVDKKWRAAEEDLWIRKEDANLRELNN